MKEENEIRNSDIQSVILRRITTINDKLTAMDCITCVNLEAGDLIFNDSYISIDTLFYITALLKEVALLQEFLHKLQGIEYL